MPDALMLALRTRAGSRDEREVLSSERVFYDFFINGASLLDQVARQNSPNADMTSVLTVNWPLEPGSEDLAPLLGAVPSPLGDERVALYVCPVCGDTECGALTAVLSVSHSVVTWTDLGWYTQIGIEGLEGLGPFTFDRVQYVTALASAPQFAEPRRRQPRLRRPWSLRRVGH